MVVWPGRRADEGQRIELVVLADRHAAEKIQIHYDVTAAEIMFGELGQEVLAATRAVLRAVEESIAGCATTARDCVVPPAAILHDRHHRPSYVGVEHMALSQT